MLKKLIRINLDNLWFYAGVEGGVFLLLEVILCCVMRFVKPEDGVTVCGILMPILAGVVALIAGITHVGVSFEQALRFGQTRRRAIGLTLGVMAFESAFGLALGAALAALERFVCPSLWAALAGADGWVPFPMPTTGNVLKVETFTLEWYWWLLAFAAGLCGGLIAGAVIQRFGAKGGWIIYGVCMAPVILGQFLPWKKYEITNWLFPLLGILFVAGLIWSVWSMFHAVVRA